MNDEKIDATGKLQIGGAALMLVKKRADLTWKCRSREFNP
jgi:hypothetical protein